MRAKGIAGPFKADAVLSQRGVGAVLRTYPSTEATPFVCAAAPEDAESRLA